MTNRALVLLSELQTKGPLAPSPLAGVPFGDVGNVLGEGRVDPVGVRDGDLTALGAGGDVVTAEQARGVQLVDGGVGI